MADARDQARAVEREDRRAYGVVREILDNELVDREQRHMGNVDGLTLEIPASGPPRITHIEVGGTTLPDRLTWPFRPLLRWSARRWGALHGQPYRIPWSCVTKMDLRIQLDVDADQTPALRWEHWLRDQFVRRIPWS